MELPQLQNIYNIRCKKKAHNIIMESSHPAHELFLLLSSKKCYRSIKSHTTCLSKTFFPQAVRLLNSWHSHMHWSLFVKCVCNVMYECTGYMVMWVVSVTIMWAVLGFKCYGTVGEPGHKHFTVHVTIHSNWNCQGFLFDFTTVSTLDSSLYGLDKASWLGLGKVLRLGY